ncbi:MAG: glycosyl transferase family 39 [Chloroflexi bacterium]|nr:glycosyl transferase family 39 [Chloroflexota bacterium]
MSNHKKQIGFVTPSIRSPSWLGVLKTNAWMIGVVGVFIALVYRPALLIEEDSGVDRHYPLLADAFLHGRFDIESELFDNAIHDGKVFVPYPPFPAVVLIPQVALFGPAGTSAILAGIILSALSLFSLVRILQSLGIGGSDLVWATGAFFLGTGYWVALNQGQMVYYFSHIVAVCCLFLSIWFSLRYGNGLLGGLFLGLAFLSRQLTVFAGIWIVILLWASPQNGSIFSRPWRIAMFGIGLGVCVVSYLIYNWARFGNVFETGYSMIALSGVLQARVEKYGLFNIAYVPYNLIYMFLQGPAYVFGGPRTMVPIGMDPFGTSLTFASPFCLIALRARLKTSWQIGIWASIGLILSGVLLYYNNGWVQWNTQRYSLDFLPLLIVLVAIGMRKERSYMWKLAVLFAVALNSFLVGKLL